MYIVLLCLFFPAKIGHLYVLFVCIYLMKFFVCFLYIIFFFGNRQMIFDGIHQMQRIFRLSTTRYTKNSNGLSLCFSAKSNSLFCFYHIYGFEKLFHRNSLRVKISSQGLQPAG